MIGIARARAQAFGKTRVWVSIGRDDSFTAANAELVGALRANGQKVSYLVGPGDHSLETFWTQAPAAFRFYAAALANC